MGIFQSKERKHSEKRPSNQDIKDRAAKEAVAEKETDFNHDEANYIPGNLNNTANTSQGLGPTQLISHHMEASNGNEAMLTRMHQVPAAVAPQNREQSIHKAVNVPQDADPVKYTPYLASAVRVTQQHTSTDKKTSTPKPMLQQATPARPAAGPRGGVKITAGELDAPRHQTFYSDIQRPQDVREISSQQQSRPSTQVQQQTTPVQHLRKQQENRQVMYGHTQHKESRNVTPSQQKTAAEETTEVPLQTGRTDAPSDMDSLHNADLSASVQVLYKDTSPQVQCSFGSKEQQEMVPQLPASKEPPPVHGTYKGVVRGVTTEKLHSKEVKTQTKAKINKSSSQKSNCVLSHMNKASTDPTCHATGKAHNIAQQSTSTKQSIAEVPAAKPTEPPDHSRQMSSQPKDQVNNEENALHKRCFNHNSVTNKAEDYQYCFSAKPESSRDNAAKMRLRQKLAKKIKAQRGDDSNSSQQTAEETVTTVRESSQQQGCTATEENTIKKHNEPHQIPQPNKADNDTKGNACKQKVNMKAQAPQGPMIEGVTTAAPNSAATHNPTAAPDTSVKLRLQHERKVSLREDTAAKPKEKCRIKALSQNQQNTGNPTMKEEIKKNGQIEKEKQEPAVTTAVTPELVCAEGRWPPFTVNQSCSRKVRCQLNPVTGLPPNVQKWISECQNHLR